MLDPARHALVGLRCKAQLRAGAHLTVNGNSQGWVTSATRSVVFGGWIALGMLRHGRGRMGETIRVESPLHGESIEAMIVNPHMYDPENARVRG
jgi:sarcosine oxidase subunit alpha